MKTKCRKILIYLFVISIIMGSFTNIICFADNPYDYITVRGNIKSGEAGVNVAITVYAPGKSDLDIEAGKSLENVIACMEQKKSEENGAYRFRFKAIHGYGEYTAVIRSADSESVEIKKIEHKPPVAVELKTTSAGNIFTDKILPEFSASIHNGFSEDKTFTLNYRVQNFSEVISEGTKTVDIKSGERIVEKIIPQVDKYGIFDFYLEIPEINETVTVGFSKIKTSDNKNINIGVNVKEDKFKPDNGIVDILNKSGVGIVNRAEADSLTVKSELSLGITAEVTTNTIGRIFFDPSCVGLDLKLQNTSGAFDGMLCWEVSDGTQVINENMSDVSIEAEKILKMPLNIKTDRYGKFTVVVELKNKSGNLISRSKPFEFSVVNAPYEGVRDENLGITVHATADHIINHGEPSVNMDFAQRAGFGFIRNEVWWRYYEREEGVYQFPWVYNKAIKKAKELNLEVIPILTYSNLLITSENPPVSDDALLKFAQFGVNYKQDLGRLTDEMSVWNEYNHPGFNKDGQPPESYAKMLKAVYPALKEENTFVWGLVTAGVDSSFIKRVFEAGGGDYMDGIDVHHYSEKTTPEDGGFVEDLLRLKQIMNSYGQENKPVYMSENGWRSSGVDGYTNEAQQAAYNVRVRVLDAAYDLVDKYAYYTMNDGDSSYGLLKAPSSKIPYEAKPSYLAIANYNKLMMNSSFSDLLELDSDVTAYRFKLSNGKDCIIMWSLSGENEKTLNLGTDNVTVYDIYGNAEDCFAKNGNYTFNLTEEPLYISGEFSECKGGEKSYSDFTGELENKKIGVTKDSISSLKFSDAGELVEHLVKKRAEDEKVWLEFDGEKALVKSQFSKTPYGANATYVALACFNSLIDGYSFENEEVLDESTRYEFKNDNGESLYVQFGNAIFESNVKELLVYDIFGNESRIQSENGRFEIFAQTPLYFKKVSSGITVKSGDEVLTAPEQIKKGDAVNVSVEPMEVDFEEVYILTAGYRQERLLNCEFKKVSRESLKSQGAYIDFTSSDDCDEFKVVISENVEYDPESLVSREDFAVYTAKLLGLKQDNAESRYFVDVPSGSYGTWAINNLTVMNIFSRNPENLFYPENSVDLNQVYKVLTTVLGYDMYAEANGGYPMGYRSAAIEADINLSDGAEANFKNVMVLLYRTAQAQIYERVVTGNSFEYSKSGETILSKYHDIYFDEGTVESICGMTTLRDNYTEQDSVRINGNVYDLDTAVFTPDYLGRYVKYFYVDNDEELSVKMIFTVAEEEEISVLIEDVVSISSESLVYSDEKDREKRESLDGVLWVYNGAPLGANLAQTLAGLNKGSVTLCDSDDDGDYDCVIIWDYKNFVVSGINSEDFVVYNKLESGGKLSIEEFDAVNIFDEKGNSLLFDDISVENVLSVAASKDAKVLNIIVSATEFNGTLSQILDEETIVINGTKYTIEPSYMNEFKAKKILIGYVYNYKTDAFGNIAYVYDGASGNPMKFGYVLKGLIVDTDEGEKVRLEILTPDEGVKKVFLADKAKVDGARYKDIKGLFEAFPKVEKGEIKPQMIRYEADSEGNIKTVDTLNLNDDYETKDNSLTVIGDDSFSLKWYMKNRIGMLAYVNNTHTNVYAIPQKSLSEQPDSTEYKVGTVNSMLRDDRAIYANIYTASGRSEYADVLVRQYQYSELIKDNEVILVDKITTAVNEDGEIVKQISGLSQGSEIVIDIPDDVDCGEIGTGDLIQLRYGINDQVVPTINQNETDIIMLYDYSKYKGGMPLLEDWRGVTDTVTLYALVNNAYYHNYRAETQLSYGTVIAKEGNSIWWSYKDDDTEDEMFNIASIPVMVYDSSERVGQQIYKGTIDDIEDLETVGTGSKIIMQTNVGIGKGVFVFK